MENKGCIRRRTPEELLLVGNLAQKLKDLFKWWGIRRAPLLTPSLTGKIIFHKFSRYFV